MRWTPENQENVLWLKTNLFVQFFDVEKRKTIGNTGKDCGIFEINVSLKPNLEKKEAGYQWMDACSQNPNLVALSCAKLGNIEVYDKRRANAARILQFDSSNSLGYDHKIGGDLFRSSVRWSLDGSTLAASVSSVSSLYIYHANCQWDSDTPRPISKAAVFDFGSGKAIRYPILVMNFHELRKVKFCFC